MTSTIIGNAAERPCTQCSEVKPISEFRVRRNGSGARYPRRICKPCEHAKEQEPDSWRTRAVHRAAVLAEMSGPSRRERGREGPLPTREDMRHWYYDQKCRLRAKDRERTL